MAAHEKHSILSRRDDTEARNLLERKKSQSAPSSEPVKVRQYKGNSEPVSKSVSRGVDVNGSGTEVMLSVARLMEAQRLMIAVQVQAMAAQSVPPLPKFSGEDINTEEGSVDRWIERIEERAKATGWNEEQKLFQLKAHLEKTAEHAVRMLPEEKKSKYDSVVTALRNRFCSLDIEELRGLEFHQLMQDKQGVEELGVELQKLGRKAFPPVDQRSLTE